ncbi:protein CFAP20DC isoform X15 [Hippopotamus amphibius kiboko]|uniref:protein CFAP20DC isoform X15 n=1 Tax=Hippopotamus amphibius kiboko TaxID=575201 RepID=UPI002592A75D|nr:protein CFAP20DC isoform X15 [Hippopotamus amphibius kiboko]
MFKNEYQGGAFVEVFSAQGKNPGANWKILGSPSVIWKEFDKEVKSFVFVLEGSSQTNKIQLPKENKQILGLIQRFLVLQIYIPLGRDFSTELLITDLRNIKRRLYLSTVHKELSSTPLHAKIPLFMIKRKIWCNLCIDLVAFTSEIFKGAVFQSLDGIIVSANCKLRKIFTLKYKPQDTADKDDEPTDIIPRSCQLTTDVPQVTQLLNMTKLRQTEIKSAGHPLSSAESGNSSGNNRNEHKATTVLTTVSQKRTETFNPSSPAPPSPDQADEWIFPENDDYIPHLASSTQSLMLDGDSCHTCHLWLEASKESEHDQQMEETQIVSKDVFTFSSRPRSAPHGKTQNMSPEECPFILDLKEDTSVTRRDTQLEDDFYVGDSSEEGNHSIQGSPGPATSPPGLTQLTLESLLGKTARWTSKGYLKNAYAEAGTSENQNSLVKQIDKKDSEMSLVPTSCFSPPGRRSESSPKLSDSVIKAKDLPAHQVSASVNKTSLQEISGEKLKPIPEVSEYDWRNYQPSQMSESELQMLASLRRQQNEELEDSGAPHGLSASQVDNCNVSISTSSDDTTTWNSCLPPPVNQGHHYQKEMNPPSPSNPRDWLTMLSPPIVPPSQQPAERRQGSSGSLSAQGEEDPSVEEDEEVLTLLYDPCLNCYFDPQTGKYYELV